jgi:hypothetical protein
MPTIVPLLSEQVAAATRLRALVPQWTAVEQALSALQQALPDLRRETILLKVVALNGLFVSSIHGVHAAADHVMAVLAVNDRNTAGAELVDTLARLPGTGRHHTTFASRFAHFFIAPDRFPIMDGYAVTMVRHHLARATLVSDPHRPYWAFVENLSTLRMVSGVVATPRELDAYFWIAGAYLAWRQDKTVAISAELRHLFQHAHPDVVRDLAVVGGAPATQP